MYCDFVTRLWCSALRVRVPVYLVPGDIKLQGADHLAFVRKAREEWQDRIAGGDVCWAVKEDWAYVPIGVRRHCFPIKVELLTQA